MPLSVRQFELGIDQEIDDWMRQIYELLARNRQLAYSSQELAEAVLGISVSEARSEKFQHSLDALVEIWALEKRWVDDTDYYAFSQEFDTTTWEPDISSHRV